MFNFPKFNVEAAKLRDQGHEVFNPADKKHHDGVDISENNPFGLEELAAKQHGFTIRKALTKDLAYICTEAEAIVMLPGWEKSRGARAERAVAKALGLEIIYL